MCWVHHFLPKGCVPNRFFRMQKAIKVQMFVLNSFIVMLSRNGILFYDSACSGTYTRVKSSVCISYGFFSLNIWLFGNNNTLKLFPVCISTIKIVSTRDISVTWNGKKYCVSIALSLASVTGFRHWRPSLASVTGVCHWHPSLASVTGVRHWHPSLASVPVFSCLFIIAVCLRVMRCNLWLL